MEGDEIKNSLRIDARCNFCGALVHAARLQHFAWKNSELLHSGDEGCALQAEAAGGTIMASNSTARIPECLDDLIAIDIGENASDWQSSGRVRGWAVRV